MVLTLEQFTDAINGIIDTNHKNEQFSASMEEFSGSWFISELGLPATDTLLRVLEIIFDDRGEWISYWIYELDYGTRDDLSATNADGTPIPLKTIEDLYTLLIKNKIEREVHV